MKEELKDESQNIFLQVEPLLDRNIMYSNWIGTDLTIDQIKEGGALILKQIAEHKTSFIMSDNRQLIGGWDMVVIDAWIADHWMPKVIEAGVKKFAHLLPNELFTELSAEFMKDNTEELEGDFKLRLFHSQEEAEKWLAE
ncbi:hypothetical protein Fleli_2669 [Bernardetia litoralis DSM 6794]|uniref:STAS/SEC14 domain-containing protein n=1 Tax=Bernardetia litoralis (strain ATCC 23117 / DSM 6794 / NBRC 15988 / NCIMB 1366 / Fx l1 / Sio-4) TaxID=880071 RepID=I4AM41_BERLS|nr:hypothetical protein [Bernardetia litoralis]AFM05026.1 hypothetical protein Fleli_2669 [Bernardetia litoralis DSM 6794]